MQIIGRVMLVEVVYSAGFTKVMQLVMVNFARTFFPLSRSVVKIAQIGFATGW